ncbi:MAG TPA: carboxypeptidase regulatory-like domain-containing protein, partial [Thermoanaerobaculia bacterium]|nr:carboxypeptidase regulatory-like domain-containing protein [Thermoanaerobaculia bacterium]
DILGLPVALDPRGATAHLYGTDAYPETWFIAPSGEIVQHVVGPVDWSSPKFRAFAAVTDKEGRFAFPLVPPGTYRLRTWHELVGEKSQPVTVASSGAAKADVALSLLDASN